MRCVSEYKKGKSTSKFSKPLIEHPELTRKTHVQVARAMLVGPSSAPGAPDLVQNGPKNQKNVKNQKSGPHVPYKPT